MKYKLLSLFFICAAFCACSDNDNNTPAEDSEIKKWVYNTLDNNYLWEVPSNPSYSSSTSVSDFFTSLLSSNDGKVNADGTQAYYYSYIENVSSSTRSFINTDYSYGFEFTAYLFPDPYEMVALVNYVLDDSPASEAGLKRGDWIFEKNGSNITKSNYTTLQGDVACRFTVFRPTENGGLKQLEETINMGTARAVEDNPVYHYDFTLETPNGKSVGYLVYNSFTAGKGSNDSSYDNELKALSSRFNSGAKDFILDLRYNNGGLVTSAQLLCNVLCPASALNKDLCYLKYRDGSKKEYKLNLGSSINLDIENLYVLTTSNTASASELVINCLSPYMNVVVIGDVTEGKNVGSVTYTSSDKNWEMHPIVCYISNSNDFSDYADGIEPDYYINEAIHNYDVDGGTYTYFHVLEDLGDPDERMLAATLKLIDGDNSAFDNTTRSATKQSGLTPFYHSISRKATNGVVVE